MQKSFVALAERWNVNKWSAIDERMGVAVGGLRKFSRTNRDENRRMSFVCAPSDFHRAQP